MAWFLRTSGLHLPLRSMVTRRADVFGVQSVYFRTSGRDVLTQFVRIIWTINPLDRDEKLLCDPNAQPILKKAAPQSQPDTRQREHLKIAVPPAGRLAQKPQPHHCPKHHEPVQPPKQWE